MINNLIILIIISIFILPLVSNADEISYEQTCERAEGCALVAGAVTLEDYCPTCTIKTIVTRTPEVVMVPVRTPVKTRVERIPSDYSDTNKFLIAWYRKETKKNIHLIQTSPWLNQ